ncbi:MAG: TonB-dependent receptor [Verrucomicrobiae bacterium]|nr:TonB-dependent receptor [Verrucomicrobiae bacterium]
MKIAQKHMIILALGLLPLIAQSQTQSENPASERLKKPVLSEETTPATLGEVVVYGEGNEAFAAGTMPDIQGAEIYAGKKTTVTDLTRLPLIPANNYRAAFSQTPGVFISESPNRGIVNITYRGIGDPHEGQDVLLLQDGIPIQNSLFGYPTAYYSTPLQLVEKIEFIRGGSALLYGPQPGPVINYVTKDPAAHRAWSVESEHVMGSYGLYNTFTKVSGTSGEVGYAVSYVHDQSDNDRIHSGYGINGGNAKVIWRPGESSKLTFGMDAFDAAVEEAGRLTLAQFQSNRFQTLTPHDELRWNRYVASLHFEHRFSAETLLTAKTWGGYSSRYSTRERFTAARVSNLNSAVDLQEFYNWGLETRVKHDWSAWENVHTFTGGFETWYSDSPRMQKRTPTGTIGGFAGNTRFLFDRSTVYGSLFAENRFKFGDLSLVPAFRQEIIHNDVRETFNADKTTAPLVSLDQTDTVSLFGFGIQYELPDQNQAYFNFSQGYKPPGYDNLAPTGNALAATDLKEGRTWSYELGMRGTPARFVTYDASVFLTDYEDQFGNFTVAPGITQFRNSGDAYYRGFEAAVELDFSEWIDAFAPPASPSADPKTLEGRRETFTERYGHLILSGNVTLLDAAFDSGPLQGRTPDYAPAYLVKYGPIYRYKDLVKVAFLGQVVDRQFWQDSNAAANGLNAIPGFTVFDLSSEARVCDPLSLLFGINNIFDEDYYSRVRSDGIEPALRRNFYGGVKVAF